MATEMDTAQRFTVTLTPKNRKGQPAPVDGPPTWLTSNSDVLALAPSADGLSCVISSTGMPGSASWQATADADMGSGVTPIVATGDVNVALAPATTVDATVGPVEDIP